MVILHISTPLSWRGGEQQLAYLAHGLYEKQAEQTFICAESGAMHDYCLEHEWMFFPIRTGWGHTLSNALLISRICRNYKVDLIHTHDSGAHTLAFVSGLLGNVTPLVVSRKVDFPVGNSYMSRKKYNSPRIAAFICVSQQIAYILGQSVSDKSKINVVYDGIETQASGQKPDLHALFQIPQDKKIIGNVAALAPHKDYFTWVDTADILLEKQSNLHFLVIGGGPVQAEIKNYISRKGLDNNITLTGFREDAKDILSGFDIFLNTSRTEGLGSSILDAFVRQVPVVATAAGGVPEIVISGLTGLLAPVADPPAIAEQVLALLNDPALGQRLVANALQFSNNFDKKVMVNETFQIYQQLISGSKP
jgi:glycosyltransferase involved in cell wall biosynthesis